MEKWGITEKSVELRMAPGIVQSSEVLEEKLQIKRKVIAKKCFFGAIFQSQRPVRPLKQNCPHCCPLRVKEGHPAVRSSHAHGTKRDECRNGHGKSYIYMPACVHKTSQLRSHVEALRL